MNDEPDDPRVVTRLAELSEVLIGTPRFFRQFREEMGSTPAPESPGSRPVTITDPLVPPDVHLWPFQSSLLLLIVSGDHLGSMGALCNLPARLFGVHVLARSAVETAARAWWLLDPVLEADEHLARSLTIELSAARELSKAEASFETEFGNGQDLIESTSTLASQLGLPVLVDRSDQPYAVGTPLPNSTELIGNFMSTVGVQRGSGLFRYWSGVAHGTQWAIAQNLVAVEGEDSTYEFELPLPLIDSSICFALRAYAEAVDRSVEFAGWDVALWNSWQLNIFEKIGRWGQ
jgi:hypothetical protein